MESESKPDMGREIEVPPNKNREMTSSTTSRFLSPTIAFILVSFSLGELVRNPPFVDKRFIVSQPFLGPFRETVSIYFKAFIW